MTASVRPTSTRRFAGRNQDRGQDGGGRAYLHHRRPLSLDMSLDRGDAARWGVSAANRKSAAKIQCTVRAREEFLSPSAQVGLIDSHDNRGSCSARALASLLVETAICTASRNLVTAVPWLLGLGVMLAARGGIDDEGGGG